MTVIVRNDRGKVLARFSRVGTYIDVRGVKQRMTPVELHKVAVEMAAFAGGGTVETSGEKAPPSRPPSHGPGSSREAWAAYAQSQGVEVYDDMSRDAVIEAVLRVTDTTLVSS